MIEQWLRDRIECYTRMLNIAVEQLDASLIESWERRELKLEAAMKYRGRLAAYLDMQDYLIKNGYTVVPKEMVEKLYA